MIPLPTAYTETQIATLMHTTLGATATALGYAAPSGSPGVYQEAVFDALILYGVTDIANATSVSKIRAAAVVAAWRKAANDAAAKIAFAGDGQSFSDQMIFEHCLKMLATAESDALAQGAGLRIGVSKLRFRHDPYNVSLAETDRTL